MIKSDELLNGDGTGEHVLGIIRKPQYTRRFPLSRASRPPVVGSDGPAKFVLDLNDLKRE